MLNDLINPFKLYYEKYGDKIILDNHRLTDGLYIRINKDSSMDKLLVKNNEISGESEYGHELLEWFRQRDYYSLLLNNSSNKAVDSVHKRILSTNVYTLFFKASSVMDSKKTLSVPVDTYFENLTSFLEEEIKAREGEDVKNPDYPNYILQAIPETDIDLFVESKNALCNALPDIEEFVKVELAKADPKDRILTDKSYIRMFYNTSIDNYKREHTRYLYRKVCHNKQRYYKLIDGIPYGIPDSNITLNDKKPFLNDPALPFGKPLLLPLEEIFIRQKLLDWLVSIRDKANKVYIPTNVDFENYTSNDSSSLANNPGTKVFTMQGTNIIDYECLPPIKNELDFVIENVVELKEYNSDTKEWYVAEDKEINTFKQLEKEIKDVFFSIYVRTLYEEKLNDKAMEDIPRSIQGLYFQYKSAFYNFFHCGYPDILKVCIDRLSLEIVRQLFRNGKEYRCKKALNLRFALLKHFNIGGMSMPKEFIKNLRGSVIEIINDEDKQDLETDDQFYFLVGQVASYLVAQSKSEDKRQSLLFPLTQMTEKNIKKVIMQLHQQYSHELYLNHKKFNKAMALIMGYTPTEPKLKKEDIFTCGMFTKSIFYEKSETQNTDEEQIA